MSTGSEQEATPVVNLIAALSGLDITISVVGVYKDLESDEQIPITRNCTLYCLRAPRWSGMPVAYVPRLLKIFRFLRALRPDIVHGQGTEREYALAALLSGFPNVITIHGMLREVHCVTKPPVYSPSHVGRWLERLVFRRIDHIVAISAYAQRQLARYTAAKLVSIPNAVNEMFYRVERRPPEPKFVFVGSVYPLKGVADLIAAGGILDREGRTARIIVCGPPTSPAYAGRIQSESRSFVNVVVEHIGWQPAGRIAEELSTALALVHPARTENAPMAVAEALCAGVPVIGTPVGAIPDWIEDGVTGYIVPIGQPALIADRMRALLDDPALSARMGTAARAASGRFSAERVAAATLEYYTSVLEHEPITTEGNHPGGLSENQRGHSIL